jgi:hypothetical protein
MSKDAIAKTKILSPADAPAVSTILEVMFHLFDESIRSSNNYTRIKRNVRLRLGLMVLARSPPDSLLLAWH